MADLGKVIRDRRKELDLTLEEVGEAVGVGKSTVLKWENGSIKNIGSDKVGKLANILQMDPMVLISLGDLGERMAAITQQINERMEKYNSMVPSDLAIGNYISDQDKKILDVFHQRPKLITLFDCTKDISDSDVDFIIEMAERMNTIHKKEG